MKRIQDEEDARPFNQDESPPPEQVWTRGGECKDETQVTEPHHDEERAGIGECRRSGDDEEDIHGDRDREHGG